jgi:uncharacterized coiled-coil protein SlyX
VNDEPTPMNVQKPVFKNEFNLTTAATLLGIVTLVGGWVWSASGTAAQIGELDRKFTAYTVEHAQLHKDRNIAITAQDARSDQRLISVETAIQTQARKQDQLEYRTTVQEQGSASLSRSVEELKNTVNGQSADIRVMLEILKRFDVSAKNVKPQN